MSQWKVKHRENKGAAVTAECDGMHITRVSVSSFFFSQLCDTLVQLQSDSSIFRVGQWFLGCVHRLNLG